jgi:hypothetical protein
MSKVQSDSWLAENEMKKKSIKLNGSKASKIENHSAYQKRRNQCGGIARSAAGVSA